MSWFDDTAQGLGLDASTLGWQPQIATDPPPADPSAATAPAAPAAGGQPFDREAFRDAWQASGQSLPAFLQSNPTAAGVQVLPGKGDRVQLPTGEQLDLVQNAGGGNTGAGGTGHLWLGSGNGLKVGQTPGGPPSGGSGAAGFGPGGGGYPPGALGGPGGTGSGAGSGGFTPFQAPNATPAPDRLSYQPLATPNAIPAPDRLNYQTMNAPAPFQGVSAADLQADPSYQFRLNQGQQTLENSAAAKGLLHTGGTAKALEDYGQNAASQEYGNVYNRKLGEYQQGFQNAFSTNQANNQNAYQFGNANTQNALQANAQNFNQSAQANQINNGNAYQFGNANTQNALAANNQNFTQAFNTNQANNQGSLGFLQANNAYNLGQGNLGLGYLQANNAYSLGQGNLALQNGYLGLAGNNQAFNQDLSTFDTNYGVYNNNQNTAFNQNYALAQLGAGATNQYANNATNLVTGQGNAAAAGTVGSANAWNSALGWVGNYFGQQQILRGSPTTGGYGGAGSLGYPGDPYSGTNSMFAPTA